MGLSNEERLLAEAVDSMLQFDAKYGIADGDNDDDGFTSQFPYMHENIEQQFRLDADTKDLKYCDAICSTFNRVHAHKYLDDPKFTNTLMRELSAQGVPREEQAIACDIVGKIVERLSKGTKDWAEKDLGSGTNLNDINNLKEYQA